VIGLVTNAAGVLSETHSYTAYGLRTVSTGSPYQFAGRRFDPETGLYYNRARMYSPALGRFLQADPSGTKGGVNLYAYTNNDPVNATDPSGLILAQNSGASGTCDPIRHLGRSSQQTAKGPMSNPSTGRSTKPSGISTSALRQAPSGSAKAMRSLRR
jgi:RHS repeat-associated protein